MRVTLKKDNFYSIMYNSFVNAQNYLINNSTKLNINLKYSGSTGIVLLFPHNNSNKIYCANVGRNKCMFYTNYGTIKLSYELFPHRASERFRISHFLTQKKIKDKEKEEQNINLNQWFEKIEKESPKDCIVVLIGNKCDKKDEIKIDNDKASNFANDEFGIKYFESSAKTGFNLNEIFDYLIDEILKVKEENQIDDTIIIKTKIHKSKTNNDNIKKCCKM